MPLQVVCPACKTEMRVPPMLAGKRALCNQCRTPFLVPHDAPEAPPPRLDEAKPQPPAAPAPTPAPTPSAAAALRSAHVQAVPSAVGSMPTAVPAPPPPAAPAPVPKPVRRAV